jgi:HK97 family phage major capsid protein
MKRLLEIKSRLEEIMKINERGEATDEMLAEVDELLKEKRTIEVAQKELRSKFDEGFKIEKPEEGKPKKRDLVVTETLEYREQFREYLTTGKAIELRVDATTLTSDIGSIIPNTILNKIVEAMKDYGDIYARITKTNFKGGVDVPTASAKPTASWTSEGSVADKQKKATGVISFSYYKLQMRVAISLVGATVSLDSWETTVASNIAEAMVVAIEEAVLAGSGIGEPLGIVEDTDVPAAQIVEFVAADATWEGWKTNLFSSIPIAYRKKGKGIIITNPLTWDKYMDGMVDSNGQPIAKTNYGLDGTQSYRFMGKEVLLRDELEDLDSAITSLDTPFLIYIDLKDYMFNSNLQIGTRRDLVEDTDEYVQKSTLIGDGKLADRNGVVILKTPAV